ncbi:copper amine oxidase [Bacillus sp. FJAT-18019]|nr:copper amine oxidase [Bacillus sp. FJAT-18019]
MNWTKGLKTMAAAAILTTVLSPAIAVSPVSAASKPTATINNVKASGEVLIRQGTTFVTLTDLKPLGNYVIKYDNSKKQVTIQGDNKTVILTAGHTSMDVGGVKKTLPAAPVLHKGKTMIPLRAVAQAFDASVYWNGSLKTAYINKAEADIISDLKSSDLATARNAATRLAYTSQLKKPELEMSPVEMQGWDFYFPKGETNRYFMVDNDIASYFEIHGGVKYLKWQGKLDYNAKVPAKQNLFFLPAIIAEIGKQPDVRNSTFAKFVFRYPSGVTSYRLINHTDEWAAGWVELDSSDPDYRGEIVSIPEE